MIFSRCYYLVSKLLTSGKKNNKHICICHLSTAYLFGIISRRLTQERIKSHLVIPSSMKHDVTNTAFPFGTYQRIHTQHLKVAGIIFALIHHSLNNESYANFYKL